ncbi:hypothetical protein [Pseudoalteromonas sp. SK20]|uniref:hypothetical protein n=1 Tax=Pseudoalteromonas sp. SK20 TaxID=1938367 RepID=UPI000978A11C|nr:hypothetical protein [Pseudoalteromonas sp. SK20]
MITRKFSNLLKELQDIESSRLYSKFVTTLEAQGIQSKQAPHHQWVEVWLESSSPNSIFLTDQGVYTASTVREIVFAELCKELFGALNIEYTDNLTPAVNDRDLATEIEIARWLEFDADWVIELLTALFCNEQGIKSDYLETNLNGRFSVMADSFNERLRMAKLGINIIETGEINSADFDAVFNYFGGLFILSFCDNEIIKHKTLTATDQL